MAETIAALLGAARRRLAAVGIDSAVLDARLLLQAATGLSHEAVIGAPETVPDAAAAARFERYVQRRLAHEPVSKIIGWREFYGRCFMVTADVLDPRPDTETLIEAALPLLPPGGRLLDLGTGSGAIAVTLLAERPDAAGVAVDLSAAALAVAAGNAEALGVAPRLRLAMGSWFEPVEGRFDLIVSNPPYIPAAEMAGLPPDVLNHDPHLALQGGADGLDAYRAIAAGAGGYLAPGGHILVEIGAGQAAAVSGIFVAAGFPPAARHADLAGHIRCLGFAAP